MAAKRETCVPREPSRQRTMLEASQPRCRAAAEIFTGSASALHKVKWRLACQACSLVAVAGSPAARRDGHPGSRRRSEGPAASAPCGTPGHRRSPHLRAPRASRLPSRWRDAGWWPLGNCRPGRRGWPFRAVPRWWRASGWSGSRPEWPSCPSDPDPAPVPLRVKLRPNGAGQGAHQADGGAGPGCGVHALKTLAVPRRPRGAATPGISCPGRRGDRAPWGDRCSSTPGRVAPLRLEDSRLQVTPRLGALQEEGEPLSRLPLRLQRSSFDG